MCVAPSPGGPSSHRTVPSTMQDDTEAFLRRLRRAYASSDLEAATLRRCIDPRVPIHVARAPGRLDVMGGFADYSGSDALLLPTREACHAAVQIKSTRETPALHVVSMHERVGRKPREFHVNMVDIIRSDTRPVPLAHVNHLVRQAAQRSRREGEGNKETSTDSSNGDGEADQGNEAEGLESDASEDEQGEPHWSCYVVSCLVALAEHDPKACSAFKGKSLSVVVDSSVPKGQGASSSASLELATMGALIAATTKPTQGKLAESTSGVFTNSSVGSELGTTGTSASAIDYLTRAKLCHLAEVYGVGAPCGAMDQIACAFGRKDAILRLSCRPAKMRGHVGVPRGIRIWAIASGVKRSVAGNAYAAARVAAFMGKTVIKQILTMAIPLHGKEATLRTKTDHSTKSPEEPSKPSHRLPHDLLEDIGLMPKNCLLPEQASPEDSSVISFTNVLEAEKKADLAMQATASLNVSLVDEEVDHNHWIERALSGEDFYLTELSSEEFEVFQPFLPHRCFGFSFLEKFPEGHGDEATHIDPLVEYPIRSATAHPVQENARAKSLEKLLLSVNNLRLPQLEHLHASLPETLSGNQPVGIFDDPPEGMHLMLNAMAALMHASHSSYTACGLGCPEADKIVAGVKKSSNLLGARLSGGGAGGAVCILGLDNREAQAEVRAIAAQIGSTSHVLEGSSDGAESTGECTILNLVFDS